MEQARPEATLCSLLRCLSAAGVLCSAALRLASAVHAAVSSARAHERSNWRPLYSARRPFSRCALCLDAICFS